jgi:hypothetical protein
VHYPDAVIAGILNRQYRRTARGLSYTASRVQSLRYHWHIPLPPARRHRPAPEGELLNVTAAARQLGIAPSTLLRWLNDLFVAGEQVTPGAPAGVGAVLDQHARDHEVTAAAGIPQRGAELLAGQVGSLDGLCHPVVHSHDDKVRHSGR